MSLDARPLAAQVGDVLRDPLLLAGLGLQVLEALLAGDVAVGVEPLGAQLVDDVSDAHQASVAPANPVPEILLMAIPGTLPHRQRQLDRWGGR